MSKTTQEEAQYQVAMLVASRRQGALSEDQIAEKLGYEREWGQSPAQRMYKALKDWGLPDWLVYPDTNSGLGESSEVRDSKSGSKSKGAEKPERKARASGGALPLPRASNAESLFRADVERLEQYINSLPRLRDQLQGERFASAFLAEDEALGLEGFDLEVFDRAMFYSYSEDEEEGVFLEEEWKQVCDRYSVDPAVEEFMAFIEPGPFPLGAGHLPRGGLAELIAIHGLLSRSLEALIDSLHPDPSSADREKIYEFAEKMKVNAEKLALEVRGGKVRRGHHPGEISGWEMWEAWHLINPLRRAGTSDEQILKNLREQGFFYKGEYEPGEEGDRRALGEIRRIASLGLRKPEE